MTALTIADVKTEIRAGLGGRTDLDTRLDAIINIAQMRIARLKDFDELRDITTVNTAVTADPAADKIITLSGVAALVRYRKIYSVRLYAANQLSRKLDRVLPKRWDTKIPQPEYYARGVPTDYVLWNYYKMELWRVPDAVYALHIRFSRWPTTITGATPSNNFLDLSDMNDAIIHLSLSYAYASLQNMGTSREHYQIYAGIVKSAIDVEVEDFDTVQQSHSTDAMSGHNNSKGYNDPFVKSIETGY